MRPRPAEAPTELVKLRSYCPVSRVLRSEAESKEFAILFNEVTEAKEKRRKGDSQRKEVV